MPLTRDRIHDVREPESSCSWCEGNLTERSRFGSRRYGLARRGLYACDSCLDERAYEKPPTGWGEPANAWTVREPSQMTPGSYLLLGVGLGAFLTTVIGVTLILEGFGSRANVGLFGLYLVGAACAFVTPVRPRETAPAELARYAWIGVVGYFTLRMLDRVGDSEPAVEVALSCILALGTGWGALLTTRYGFASRRRALLGSPPASQAHPR